MAVAMALPLACPVGCTTHGVCDPVVGQCMCPLTRTGASCSELALPACAVHGQPLRPTFLLHHGWERRLFRDEWMGPLTCSCIEQMARLRHLVQYNNPWIARRQHAVVCATGGEVGALLTAPQNAASMSTVSPGLFATNSSVGSGSVMCREYNCAGREGGGGEQKLSEGVMREKMVCFVAYNLTPADVHGREAPCMDQVLDSGIRIAGNALVDFVQGVQVRALGNAWHRPTLLDGRRRTQRRSASLAG